MAVCTARHRAGEVHFCKQCDNNNDMLDSANEMNDSLRTENARLAAEIEALKEGREPTIREEKLSRRVVKLLKKNTHLAAELTTTIEALKEAVDFAATLEATLEEAKQAAKDFDLCDLGEYKTIQRLRKDLKKARKEMVGKLRYANSEREKYRSGWELAESRIITVELDRDLHKQRATTLEFQLPEELKDCTIRCLWCPKGHAILTATNWAERGCQACHISALESKLAAAEGLIKKADRLLKIMSEYPVGLGLHPNDRQVVNDYQTARYDFANRERASAAIDAAREGS